MGVFCSFSGTDFDFAHDLALTIADKSFPIWFDRFRIREIGTKLTPEIERGIASSTCLVVIVSASAHGSHWVAQEVDMARRLGRPTFQILIDSSGALPGLQDEALANIPREGRDGSVDRLLRSIDKVTPKDFEDPETTPFIPIFLEKPDLIDSSRLQRRLSLLDGIVDRLTVSTAHIAFSREGDELPVLVKRLESGDKLSKDDPLVRQTLTYVEEHTERIRLAMAEIVNNFHRLRMFRGPAVVHWSVFAAQAIAEYVRIARSLLMFRLLVLTDASFANRAEKGKATKYLDPSQLQHDSGYVIGQHAQLLDIFHKGELVRDEFPKRMWAARYPSGHFAVPENSELALDVSRWFHVEAADYPHELAQYVIPQLLLKRFINPQAAMFWDFDECAMGLH
jgi:hypothetical protein